MHTNRIPIKNVTNPYIYFEQEHILFLLVDKDPIRRIKGELFIEKS
jgi:hypothetical protein